MKIYKCDASGLIPSQSQLLTSGGGGDQPICANSLTAETPYGLRLTDSACLDPLTCFHVQPGPITTEQIQAVRSRYGREDDVFCDTFLKNILLVTDEQSLSDSVLNLLTSWGVVFVFIVPTHCEVAPGPYYFSRRGIFWAWKLFPDYQEAFVLSTIPSQQEYNMLGPKTTLGRTNFDRWQTPELPLAGMRIAIKDLFHLNGVHTGCGNRAYLRLHPASKTTSPAVQAVISKGAIVVGKTKTVEFGGSQEVVGDWVDYSYAFNARGDGYLASTGSSTGSASSLAAYPWLDITLGTDGAVIPCSRLHPTRILLPLEYYADRNDVQILAESWISALFKWLGAEIARISIAQFRKDYREAYGSAPYILPRDKGKLVPPSRKTEALGEVGLHNEWFSKHLLKDENAIMIIPRYKLDYRDEYLPPPECREFYGFDSNLHASFAGLPNIIVPSETLDVIDRVLGR
ncbi:hypothetical protein GP486_002187 [Trichoglossum hirsutum]|uniref:Amidase domain-containing protein n=1 Tax=Trichoglossum hirsutum TaxID=265104 RepID=A0A9P8RRZ1_9PEZI|nr:hypothetical protein GP486_002187 [Trichoglossum hirsutum]